MTNAGETMTGESKLSPMATIPPRTLFIADAAGAALSIVMLGVVLRSVLPLTGMPTDALAVLAALPAAFLAYDVFCLASARADAPRALKPIAAMNAGYCLVSGAYLADHAEQLTAIGWVYFVLEIAIVATLAVVQLTRSSRVLAETEPKGP
jgi:hypothetical protein